MTEQYKGWAMILSILFVGITLLVNVTLYVYRSTDDVNRAEVTSADQRYTDCIAGYSADADKVKACSEASR